MKYNIYTSSEVYLLTQELLTKQVNASTVLYLSGGSTPKHLYELITQEKIFHPGAVAMIDERFGEKWHENSNELMMKESGLLDYLKKEHIPFHPILQSPRHPVLDTGSMSSLDSRIRGNDNLPIDEMTNAYDKTLRTLHAQYPRHIALLGIGADGHIAGLKGQNSKGKIHNSQLNSSSQLVISYNDIGGMGERITQTFLALSMMDEIVVLVLGEEKRKALELMKTEGSESEIPARFLMRDTIAEKVTIITDQTV